MQKNILGLDLGTNSIGWALICEDDDEKKSEIVAAGSRIIPMSQDILGKFDSGQSISQTAERTGFRSARRLRERQLLRRERLHRVLNLLDFLPKHYSREIDFDKHPGQFLPDAEPKLAYYKNSNGKMEFLFRHSFQEMLNDFAQYQPQLIGKGKLVPYDWTIYYLRKKALTDRIEKEELAWLLLQFNQKRGYYQLRGEEEVEDNNRTVEFHSLRVVNVEATEDKKKEDEVWYNIYLENGWIYRRTSKIPLDWTGKTKEFIVTTDLNPDGSVKKGKDGKEKRSFRAPGEDDWTLIKKKTEYDIEKSQNTVGTYIYDHLLQNPNEKIRGKLVRTVERKFYKAELEMILRKQSAFHQKLNDRNLYLACLQELYPNNSVHRNSIEIRDFIHLFINDILLYQRPLKSKKSLICNCKYERRYFKREGRLEVEPLKGIPKSHPLFQEFRLWKFVRSLKLIQFDKMVDNKLQTDVDVTAEFLVTEDQLVNLFDWLNEKKEIDQKAFLKYPGFKLKKNAAGYRWNFVEDKFYPCNETRSQFIRYLNKVGNIPENFLDKGREEALWHILYSVEDKTDIEKALRTFATKNGLEHDFVEVFRKFPSFEKEYSQLSSKAIKKMLALMRAGKYWKEEDIDQNTRKRIENLRTGEVDETIKDRVREKAFLLKTIADFSGLPEWLASYIVYDRHAEEEGTMQWKTPQQIRYLPQHSLRNPIVEQLINETLQVVKDIWIKFGNGKEHYFDEIHVELGREMKNPGDKRKRMTTQNIENENTNLRIKALLAELLNDHEVENVRPYSPMQQEILKIYEEGALNSQQGIPEDILKISTLAQPSQSELIRYKLWLQQRYRSPYTGEIIPLNKLFTREYDIEHIIPQSRYFDDSFSNKVICESVVNGERYKSNMTGYEFIKAFRGQIVDELSTHQKLVKVFTEDQYEQFVKDNFSNSRAKMKKLLMEDIPETFVQRQLNDSRYISKVVKDRLSNIVRCEDERETTSKNVILSNGNITSVLRQHWGLNDVWNELITPRFEALNSKTGSNNFGNINKTTGKFLPQVPLQLQKGFSKKRIDHRHHTLDAIVIACTSRNHINYLNNESALGNGATKDEALKKRYDLRAKLCRKKYNDDSDKNYSWVFEKPWESFTGETKSVLSKVIISVKQNLRIVNKTSNRYSKWKSDVTGNLSKGREHQLKGNNWSIRKPMHKANPYGSVQLKLTKKVSLSAALNDWKMIADKALRTQVSMLFRQSADKKSVLQFFNALDYHWQGKDISEVEINYWDETNVASRDSINEGYTREKIKRITDTGIQAIMLRHLAVYNEKKGDLIVEHPELAFSPEGLEEMNKNIKALNGGKPHQPIFKVRTYEPMGNKFPIGNLGNKNRQYVEAAKGTNLFYAIYKDPKGKRKYETIPLNIVIERKKQGLEPVPGNNDAGDILLFCLSPNDLVYVPTPEEIAGESKINLSPLTDKLVSQIYKVVSFTNGRLYCIPQSVAVSIVDKVEFTQLNKVEFTPDKRSIREICVKLKTDRLGAIGIGIADRTDC